MSLNENKNRTQSLRSKKVKTSFAWKTRFVDDSQFVTLEWISFQNLFWSLDTLEIRDVFRVFFRSNEACPRVARMVFFHFWGTHSWCDSWRLCNWELEGWWPLKNGGPRLGVILLWSWVLIENNSKGLTRPNGNIPRLGQFGNELWNVVIIVIIIIIKIEIVK